MNKLVKYFPLKVKRKKRQILALTLLDNILHELARIALTRADLHLQYLASNEICPTCPQPASKSRCELTRELEDAWNLYSRVRRTTWGSLQIIYLVLSLDSSRLFNLPPPRPHLD